MPESFDDYYYKRRMRQLDREQYYNNVGAFIFGVTMLVGMILIPILIYMLDLSI